MQDTPTSTPFAIDSEAKEPPTPVSVGTTPLLPLAQTQEGVVLPGPDVDTLAPPSTASAAAEANTRAALAATSLQTLHPNVMSAIMKAVMSAFMTNMEDQSALLAHSAEPVQPAKPLLESNMSAVKPNDAIVGMVQTRSASVRAPVTQP